MVITEFGRTSKENGSGGTDHGRGNVMLVMGGQIRGGVYGRWPMIVEDVDPDRDLSVTTDFRTVLNEILTNRLGNGTAATSSSPASCRRPARSAWPRPRPGTGEGGDSHRRPLLRRPALGRSSAEARRRAPLPHGSGGAPRALQRGGRGPDPAGRLPPLHRFRRALRGADGDDPTRRCRCRRRHQRQPGASGASDAGASPAASPAATDAADSGQPPATTAPPATNDAQGGAAGAGDAPAPAVGPTGSGASGASGSAGSASAAPTSSTAPRRMPRSTSVTCARCSASSSTSAGPGPRRRPTSSRPTALAAPYQQLVAATSGVRDGRAARGRRPRRGRPGTVHGRRLPQRHARARRHRRQRRSGSAPPGV